MPTNRRNWTRDELILAFNLYCKTSFGRIHIRNPEIVSLAGVIGRSPSAVSWKLANFARLDPTLTQRSIKGASHGSKEDINIWREFSEDWERLSFESEAMVNRMQHAPSDPEAADFPEGKVKEAVVRIRLNQAFFRTAILAAYDSTCCITGIASPELLSASHIVPWSVDVRNRTNPQNGLCLNALHDRAFDRGLITISDDLRVKLSTELRNANSPAIRRMIVEFDGASIRLPAHFPPNVEFLRYHQTHIFQG